VVAVAFVIADVAEGNVAVGVLAAACNPPADVAVVVLPVLTVDVSGDGDSNGVVGSDKQAAKKINAKNNARKKIRRNMVLFYRSYNNASVNISI
jgi:hypothetical protein